jgi:membrane peptidoglycan carboxypeptidase
LASVAHIIRRRRQRERLHRQRQTRRRIGTALVIALIALGVLLPGGAVVGATAALYFGAVGDLPEPASTLLVNAAAGPTELYDASGTTLIYAVQDPLGDVREWIELDVLPPYVASATLISEDADFLTATEFDPVETVSRLWSAAFNGQVAPDTSLTARLVHNTILTTPGSDPTRETALIAEINRRYTPTEVLEWHLNTNYYGHDAYGIEAAAQVYLGKSANQLTLDETALLAAIPLAPQYNPFDNEAAARGRQQDLLRSMRRAEVISQDEFDVAIAATPRIARGLLDLPDLAPDFALYARDQVEEILDASGRDGARMVARGGLRVTTTLDLDLYYQTECTLRTQLSRLNNQQPPTTALDGEPCIGAGFLPDGSATTDAPNIGSIVIVDVRTGEVRSMVGPSTEPLYEPGPVLQPFVYFNAFRSSNPLDPASMVLDVQRSFPGAQQGLIYTPSNPDGLYRGPMNLRDAMGAGLLPPAVDIANRQGIDTILRDAHQIGLNSLEVGVHDLSLLERGGAVSVLDTTYAYSVFASQGIMRGVSVEAIGPGFRARDPVAVRRIEDVDGNVLWEYNDVTAATSITNVISTELGYLINDVLADQGTRWPVLGENNVLDLPRPSAVVNGLTGDRMDNWAVGYTPQLVVGVHLGRSDDGTREPTGLQGYALNGAASVWRAVMEYAHERDALPRDNWRRPPNIVEVSVCDRSGLLPNGNCPVETEIFIDGRQTRLTPDSYWQDFEINRQTGQLATAGTPSELRGRQVFFVPPPEAFEWWQANNLPLPPAEYDTVSRPELFGNATILQPQPFAYVGGWVDVRGSLEADNLSFYQLAYGRGLNPDRWIDIGGPQTTYTQGGSLGQWDTTGLDGIYNLRLTVVDTEQNIETRVVQITVDNVAPTISLSAGEPGEIYRWPGDTEIPLTAEVEDNLAITRVEFYRNSEFIGTDAEWPYTMRWPTEGVGTETFTATAFDAVGNNSSAEITVEILRAN